jgi:Tfp pilus tip-associated adhesin PilY1
MKPSFVKKSSRAIVSAVSRSKPYHLPSLNTSTIDMKQIHYLQVEGDNEYPGNVIHYHLEDNY